MNATELSVDILKDNVSVAVPSSCKVYTPPALAEAMVMALGIRPRESWLDPCVGEGAFPRALKSTVGSTPNITALDLEVKPQSGDKLAQTIRGMDFLAWANRAADRFDNIIANPPYMAISRLPDNLKSSALAVTGPEGLTVSRGANYWFAFLCASLRLLAEGGNLCFVLPSSWDYADYAKSMRRSFPGFFSRFYVHRCETPLFGSVLDGCVVVVAHGYREKPEASTRFLYKSTADLLDGLKTDTGSSRHGERSRSAQSSRQTPGNSAKKRLLGDLVDIRIGGVTGDAHFFILSEKQRLDLGLPTEALQPVLSRSRHLVASEMTVEVWERLREAGERVWLFNPPDDCLLDASVREYLDLPEAVGGCRRDRYKIRTRKPWHKTRLPDPIDGFISGMTHCGPWLCFRKMPALAATNTLYTFRFKKAFGEEEQVSWALALWESRNEEVVKSFARRYADGLLKYEPGDLYKIPLGMTGPIEDARGRYRDAITQMLKVQTRP